MEAKRRRIRTRKPGEGVGYARENAICKYASQGFKSPAAGEDGEAGAMAERHSPREGVTEVVR